MKVDEWIVDETALLDERNLIYYKMVRGKLPPMKIVPQHQN